MDINYVELGFIHGGVVIVFNNYDARNGVAKLDNASSEKLQRVYVDDAFGPWEAKRFSVTLSKGEEKAFR